MSKRIFIWVAHPKAGSLCEGMADAYRAAAEEAGADVRRMDLSDMSFGTAFEGYGEDAPALEPDLLRWQENLRWADHLMIVYPYWWGSLPTKAKAVLDRALTPGFAYKYRARGIGWDKLLAGKTADLLVTSDTPPLLDTLLYWRPGRRVMKNQILGFCGIRTKNALQFGSVKTASPEKRRAWISRAGQIGARAAA